MATSYKLCGQGPCVFSSVPKRSVVVAKYGGYWKCILRFSVYVEKSVQVQWLCTLKEVLIGKAVGYVFQRKGKDPLSGTSSELAVCCCSEPCLRGSWVPELLHD